MDTTPEPIRIGERRIGPGEPAYVIAEAGVNHNGEVRAAEELVKIAANAGADAVKFQAFSADRLVTPTAPSASYQRDAGAGPNQHEMLGRLELSPADFEHLMRVCRGHRIEFLATPFGIDDLTMLTRLGVRALKFASTDLINQPLLDAGIATGLPMIVSTGAATGAEIDHAVKTLTDAGARDRLMLLHCISSYPTPITSANLRAITALGARYGVVVGHSDHTESTDIGQLAVAAGASVIEKHFTIDRRLPGPDQSFSLEPDALTNYINGIRQAERALGDGNLDVLDCEQDVRNLARSSVVTAIAVHAGDVLTADVLTTKRPGGGISPTDMQRLIGQTVTRDLAADTRLNWDMLKASETRTPALA